MKLEGISSGNSRLVFFLVFLSFFIGSFLAEDSVFGADKKQRIEKIEARKLPKRDPIKQDSTKQAGKYVELEVFLGEGLTLADIESLPMAPGSEVEIIEGGKRAKIQTPAYVADAMLGSGVKAFVRRKFLLFEGGDKLAEPEGDLAVDGTSTDTDYCYGYNSTNVAIFEGFWSDSPIYITCAPGEVTTTVDVHYDIIHSCRTNVWVELCNASHTRCYRLWEYPFPGYCIPDISETVTGITTFAGEPVNQMWVLWATDIVPFGDGYIDYWWIKVYYGDPLVNNDCADAIAVTEGVPYFGSSVGATTDDTSSCGGSADVWHKFTPSESGNYIISLRDSGFDTMLAVFNHCGGTELACNDNTPTSLQSELTIDLTAGNTYYIRVAGYGGATGSYKLLIGGCSSPPVNDDCADAIVVITDVVYNGSTECATGTAQSSCSYGDTADVWHKFTPSESGNYIISLADSGFDTTLAVFNHCGGTELACNDDTPTSLQSELTIDLTAGNTYYIRVAGYDGATGSYKLLVGDCTAPVNDDCADAIVVVADVVYNGSTECATGSYVSNCSDGDTADVWHSYIPDSNETVIISLAGSSFDTTLSVFDGCGGTELACNDDSSEGLTSWTYTSAIAMDMYGGTTYLIRIAGYFGATGDYSLIINRQCLVPLQAQEPVPANDACDVPLDILLSWDGGGSLKASSYSKTPEETILPKVIYGEDDRLDEYDVSNPAILAVGDSTVTILSVGALWDNGDGTFDLPPETFAEYFLSMYGDPLCFDEPFRDQPNPAWCSGFLVAPDIIATAGHCAYPSDCGDLAFVFGFVMLDANTPRLTIDSSEIYYCSEIIEQQGLSDWALIRLDRPVVGHTPLQIRNSGIVPVDDPLLVIGHPMGLPRKYDDGGTVRSSNPLYPYFEANLDTYGGNSGSAVFNANTLVVEGILVRGNEDFVWDVSCYRSNVCPDTGCPDWEDITRITELVSFGADRYDVYLDVDNPPSTLVCSDIDTPMCELAGLLSPCERYYWRVVSKGFCGVIEGPVWSFTTDTFAADFDSSCVVDGNDLWALIDQWLLEPLSADMWPARRDGSVDFLDWACFADSWQSVPSSPHWDERCDIAPEGGDGVVDEHDAGAFVEQWLQLGEYGADIAPEGGDGIVNMLDFAVLGDEWLAGTE